MRLASILCTCLLLPASPLCAQDSILGNHKIDLRLKPLPAAQVLELLSARSKSVAQLPDRTADQGGAWDLEGADQLQGIVVAVNFVATPIHQVVTEALGCIGFAYSEHGNRIVIEKSARALPAGRCQSVSRVDVANATGAQQSDPARRHSWHVQSISALDFIELFANEAGLSIVWPFPQTELLRDIRLRVDVSDMRADDVLRNVLGCIGWQFERTNASVSAFKARSPVSPGECRGFSVL